jgi:HAD superfamily hydrolase (TIGR01509 family)
MPGAAELLRDLHERGLRLGVCSNKPVAFTLELLDYLAIGDCLDVVLGPEDVAQPKPAPDMLRAAMERLRMTANEVLYVGDMSVDVQTARAASVRVWVVPTGSDDLDAINRAGPDRIVANLFELRTLLSVDRLA